MKWQVIIFSALIFIAFSILIYGQNSDSDLNNKTELILKKCEEYSKKVENASLYFVCIERVKEEIVTDITSHIVSTPGAHGSIRTFSYRPRWEKNQYVYDYQLVKQGDKITENRILIEENGEETYMDNAPLKTKRFYSRW